jgi:hypothetical protein
VQLLINFQICLIVYTVTLIERVSYYKQHSEYIVFIFKLKNIEFLLLSNQLEDRYLYDVQDNNNNMKYVL